jgi:hypothetical protein
MPRYHPFAKYSVVWSFLSKEQRELPRSVQPRHCTLIYPSQQPLKLTFHKPPRPPKSAGFSRPRRRRQRAVCLILRGVPGASQKFSGYHLAWCLRATPCFTCASFPPYRASKGHPPSPEIVGGGAFSSRTKDPAEFRCGSGAATPRSGLRPFAVLFHQPFRDMAALVECPANAMHCTPFILRYLGVDIGPIAKYPR